jgi:hypothetical protein
MKVFSASTTATTIGNGGEPRRSTELDVITGHNCAMTKDDYTIFAIVVLGVHPGRTHGNQPNEDSFVNLLLCDYVVLTNLTAVFALNETSNRRGLAQILTHFSHLMLGAKALTQRIIERIWGSNPIVRKNLGSAQGDLALARQHLISMAIVANNRFHLWLTMYFNKATMIVPSESLVHVPPGVRDILQLVESDASAIYIRKPLPAGQDCIDILLHNLRSSSINPTSINFGDIVISWYSDLLLDYDQATHETGVDNQIFNAYGLIP